MSGERIRETGYFPFICLVWWMVDHPFYLFIRRDGLGPQLGLRLRSDRDVVMGRALMLGSLPSLPPEPTLSLVGGLSLGSAFWAHTPVFFLGIINILFEINNKIYLINFLSKYPNNLLFPSQYMLFITRNSVIEFHFFLKIIELNSCCHMLKMCLITFLLKFF